MPCLETKQKTSSGERSSNWGWQGVAKKKKRSFVRKRRWRLREKRARAGASSSVEGDAKRNTSGLNQSSLIPTTKDPVWVPHNNNNNTQTKGTSLCALVSGYPSLPLTSGNELRLMKRDRRSFWPARPDFWLASPASKVFLKGEFRRHSRLPRLIGLAAAMRRRSVAEI